MLKVNVGLSRKLSRDFNSTGFSLNLEGEICVGLDDPEGMIEKVKEFYDLAEEALSQQIERYEGESAVGQRDEVPPARTNGHAGRTSAEPTANPKPSRSEAPHPGNGNGQSPDAATNKQVQFLLNLSKRQGLSLPQLENRIQEVLGKKIGVYDLTKREAGEIIDGLNPAPAGSTNGQGRNRMSR